MRSFGETVRELKEVLGDLRLEYHRSGQFAEFLSNLYYLPVWLKSRAGGSSPLVDCMPWINYQAINRLNRFVRPGMKVFEWGVGGSTTYFQKNKAKVTSVEHDEHWSRIVKEHIALSNKQHDWEMHFIPAEIGRFSSKTFNEREEIEQYRSRSPGYETASFQSYAEAISAYPDNHFDLVMVDGRSRPACLLLARNKVRPGGLLVLDNSDRAAYRLAMDMIDKDSHREDFRGLCGYTKGITTTSVWVKENLV